MTQLVGILNLTHDSFSDGGRYLDPQAAVERGLELASSGASWIDVGAESTHPKAQDVDADEELRRLTPVVERLLEQGLRLSVDTWKPEVMRAMLSMGVQAINDVRALREPGALEAVADSRACLVLMHSTSSAARAATSGAESRDVVADILGFFEERLAALAAAGVALDRVIIDPGMGMFLSPDPEASCEVLRGLPRLAELGRPVYVSVSRKSFLGALTGREVSERGAATLAAELHAYRAGVDFIRTHDVAALIDGLAVLDALSE